MFWARRNSSRGGERRGWHNMLGLAMLGALAAFSGCATTASKMQRLTPSRPMNQAPAVVSATNNEPVRNAAASELGAKAADEIPKQEHAAPQPVDPGAAALVQMMFSHLDQRIIGPDDVTRIGLKDLRNQSRASNEEFKTFCDRFATLLNRAAANSNFGKIEFTCDAQTPLQYQLRGAAYIITSSGFDVWELYLSLSPAEKSWTAWQAANSVHVLRQPRAGEPQIVKW